MKKRIYNTLRAISACALLAVSSLSAQTTHRIRVDVPFAFVAIDQHLSAGAYEIETDYARQLVLIRGPENDSTMFALTFAALAGKPPEQAKLIFKRYGDRYFLSQVWNAGSDQVRELIGSKLEREVAMNGKPEIVALLVSPTKLRTATR